MSVRQTLVGATLVSLSCLTSSQSQAWKATWMNDMSTDTENAYSFTLFDRTIFDIVWPGANNVGMYETVILSTNTLSSSELASDLQSDASLTTEQIQQWSIRQSGDVRNTLDAGARFLQMQFEYDGTANYQSYSASLGETAANIKDDIEAFLTASPNEMLILYFSNYIDSSNRDAELQDLFEVFTDDLSTLMADKTVLTPSLLTTESISDIMATDVRIIAIADELGDGSNYVYDVNDVMTLMSNTSSIYTADELRTTAIGDLRQGWNFDTLFYLDWSININPSSLTDFGFNDNFYEYSRDANSELNGVITSFPKLRFGNIISVDFFEATDTIIQTTVLNYEYATCFDDNSATDCPTDTDLFNDYAIEATQSECLENDGVTLNSLATTCARSCGQCQYNTGSPGFECEEDTDCIAPIYTSLGAGECWNRTADYASLVAEISFCKQPQPYVACATTEDDDQCSGNTIDPETCDDRCSSNYQCDSGYCNSNYGICMSYNFTDNETPAPISDENKYNFVKSETATLFLTDIEGLRELAGGDPDGNITFEADGVSSPFEFLDKNPYLTSVIGFILIPFILSLNLFFCWFWVCCFWCWPCCEPCCKRCCCRMCLGSNPDDNVVAKWTPCVILAITTCIIVGFSIDGIVYNSKMHEHIFSDTKQSVRTEISELVDVVQDRLAGVPTTVESLIDSVFGIVEYAVDAVTNTKEIDEAVATMRNSIGRLSDNWAGNITFSNSINDPFDFDASTELYSFPCPFCIELETTLETLNDTLNEVFVEGIDTLISALNLTTYLEDIESELDESLSSFTEIINDLINSTEDVQVVVDDALDVVQGFDSYRESGGFGFFSVPFIWLIFPLLGIFLGKWCFKINWCCAMFIGAGVMMMLSFFAVLTVLWADFCVRLDDFEQNFGQSDIGLQLKRDAGLDQNDTALFYSAVNACFTGSSLLNVFDLGEYFDEIDGYKEEFQEALDLDLSNQFDSSDFDSFTTEIDLLDQVQDTSATDEAVDTLNSLNSSFCYCPVTNQSMWPVEFTRDLILDYECSNNYTLDRTNSTNEKDEYWNNIFDISENGGTIDAANALACIELYTAAYGLVFAEQTLQNTFIGAADDIITEGQIITAAVFNMTQFVFRLDRILQNVSCLVEDLFDEVDDIIAEYTSCGFLGNAYEGFKEVGCEKLFEDMYRITRAMAIIAFLSIMVTCCSMCMDYVKDPANDDDLLDDEEFNNKIASNTAGGNWDDNRPSYMQQQEMTNMQPGATEGGPGSGQTNNTHFI